ncbi:hypothetical protein GCM10027299_01570 [Larkinella ripae]
MTQTEFIKTFETFSAKDRLAIAKKLQVRLLDDLFDELDAEMPDSELSSEEIQEEINAYRHEKRQKAQNRS